MAVSLARPSARCSRNELHVAYPIALASRQAIALSLSVERSRAAPEHSRVDVVERIHTDHRIHSARNLAGHERHNAAIHADMEQRGFRPEFVAPDSLKSFHDDAKATGRARGPHATMLDAKRTTACPRRNFSGRRLPVQSEADVSAVASRDDHF